MLVADLLAQLLSVYGHSLAFNIPALLIIRSDILRDM